MPIMLSDLQQKNVWRGWLGAEVRANYFADLCHRYQRRARLITWTTLAASSGAAAAILSTANDTTRFIVARAPEQFFEVDRHPAASYGIQ